MGIPNPLLNEARTTIPYLPLNIKEAPNTPVGYNVTSVTREMKDSYIWVQTHCHRFVVFSTLKIISISLIYVSLDTVVSQQLIFGHFLYSFRAHHLTRVLNMLSRAVETVSIQRWTEGDLAITITVIGCCSDGICNIVFAIHDVINPALWNINVDL